MEKFQKVLEEWVKVNKELYETSKEFIERKVKENGGRIEFDYDEIEKLGLVNPTITYDGGNHPEYASDAFSYLWGAFIDEQGVLNLIIADCDEYEVDRVNASDLADAAAFLLTYLDAK